MTKKIYKKKLVKKCSYAGDGQSPFLEKTSANSVVKSWTRNLPLPKTSSNRFVKSIAMQTSSEIKITFDALTQTDNIAYLKI